VGTTALYPNASADVWPGGQITFAVTFESFVNSKIGVAASGVTIGITASGASDGGTGTPLAPTSIGVLNVGTGLYQYVWHVGTSVAPGSYTVTWSGTRSSDSTLVTYQQVVTVAAQPAAAPLTGVYATVAQYQAKTGDQFTPAATVQQRLQLASEQLDVALVGAVYAVDADGMPTDPGLVDTLMRACCEQARYLNAHNDDAQVKREYASTNVGGVSVSRVASMQGRALPPIAPQALAILRVAGVLPAAPLVNW
jgi:hypothetical protein